MFIAIYGRDDCPYCEKAKTLAQSIEGADGIYINLREQGMTKQDLQKTVGRPVETVPQVFIDGIHIGGYTEFEAHINQGASA